MLVTRLTMPLIGGASSSMKSATAVGMTWLYISILRAYMSNLPLSLAQIRLGGSLHPA